MTGIKSKGDTIPSFDVEGHGVISSKKQNGEILAAMFQRVSNDEDQRVEIRERKRTFLNYNYQMMKRWKDDVDLISNEFIPSV